MLRSSPSSASSPSCALSPPETPPEGSPRKNEGFGKAYQQYLGEQGPARNPYQGQRPRKRNDQPEYVSNDWRSGSYDSSNASWESDWSASRGGTASSESPGTTAFYKYRNSYQSGTDWSGDSSTYGVMQPSQQSSSNSISASSSSYYDSGDYYGYGYDQNARGGPPSGYQQYGTMPPQQYQGGTASGQYNGRNPSICPPAKQQEYQRRQTRYVMEGGLRTQIKREPDTEGGEVEGENFSSLFTKSLTSLYSQDTENTYGDDSKTYDSDIMICTPSSSASPMEDSSYQRLGPPAQGQYNPGYPNQMRNSFGFYDNRPPNCEQNVVQELGAAPDRTNSFRYDRPSFDDMHLYTSSTPESKAMAKKRKLSMPNMGPDGKNFPGGEHSASPRRKAASRAMTFKSESQWTPNSFAFSDVQIKQEPMEEYPGEDLEAPQSQLKDGSCSSSKDGKAPQADKAPPRKRSPGSTCFDRFEKKSTPQSKKVSPLSVYAKVQECVVLNVKCRRYKKRTKPANAREEGAPVYPGKEEVENWRRSGAYGESPDQAVRHLVGDLLDRVSHVGSRAVDTSGPDLSQIDVMKVRELLYQFCQRYSLDYRDFEDIDSVLVPNIMKDKTAKNSQRASAIRKRTSVSPARPTPAAPEQTEARPTPRAAKRSANGSADAPTRQADRRVLRSLPGRSAPTRAERGRARRRAAKAPVAARRRYSTRSTKDVEESTDHSDVDIIIDSSTDRDSEAGKEAEVRKTSQRLKNRQPPAVEKPQPATPEDAKPPTKGLRTTVAKAEDCPRARTRSSEKKEAEKQRECAKAAPKKKWSRLHVSSNENSMSSSGDSVEIIGSTSSSTKTFDKDSRIAVKIEPSQGSRALTAVKSSERIANRNSKMNDESSKKNMKSSDETNRRTKPDEAVSKSFRRQEEAPPKTLKAKDPLKRKAKCEESISSKASSRKSEKVTPQATTKKNQVPARRRKLSGVEKDQSTIEDDSCPSKSDDEGPSKTSEKDSGTKTLKVRKESSDESKDSLDNDKAKSKSPDATLVAKDSQPNKGESENPVDVSDDSNTNEKMAAMDSAEPANVDKTEESTCDRERMTEKPFKFSAFNERRDSMLQVKLNRLPLKLDAKKRILPIESQDFFRSIGKPKEVDESASNACSEDSKDRDLQSPPKLVCMKEPPQDAMESTDSKDKFISTNPKSIEVNNSKNPKNLVAGPPELLSKAFESTKPSNDGEELSKPLPIGRHRFSESEDSDCGLVIDLDRRLSVEERVPSPTFQPTPDKKHDSKDSISLNLVKKEPAATPPAEETAVQSSNSSTNHTEGECIVLPPSEDPLRLDSRSSSFLETPARPLSIAESDLERAKKLKDQDESILRTLLLETPEVSSKELLSQTHTEAASDIPADSKASISQDVMKLLMYQTYNEVSPQCNSPGFDEKKISIDQLTSDTSDEECSRDPRFLKEQMKKLRNEIVYLQCMIDQKDKERTAIICFKRYKEEVLKRVVKQYASSVQFRDWVRARQESSSLEKNSTERNTSDRVSTAKPSSNSHVSESPPSHISSPQSQVIQLAYHATVNSDVPTSSVVTTVIQKPPAQSSESLPTVATMIAKATENYGVDMRTVKSGTSSAQTILQKVLSSKDSVYSPTSCRSPSSEKSTTSSKSSNQQQQPVQVFQKMLSSTRESCYSPAHRLSPVPDMRSRPPKSLTPTHPQLLHKALSSKDSSPGSSRSPPSLQPELRTTKPIPSPQSSDQNKPLDLILSTAEKLKMTSSKSYDSGFSSGSKSSPERSSKHNSSPKHSSSASYSAWSSVTSRTSLSVAASTTIDLRTIDHSRTNPEPLPLSKRPHSRNPMSHSSSGPGFMVVPPPTTLQQSQKSSIIHHSRLENGHPHEKPVKSSVERIYSIKKEEERRTLTYPSTLLTASSSLPYSHKIISHSTPSSNSSIGSIKSVSQPLTSTSSNAPRCMGCGLSHAKFLCSGCRSHWYCSPECQSMRWPEHSQTCVGNIGVYNQSSGSSYS